MPPVIRCERLPDVPWLRPLRFISRQVSTMPWRRSSWLRSVMVLAPKRRSRIDMRRSDRGDSFKHHARNRKRARKSAPEQRRAERRSVARLAHRNALGWPQGRKTAREGQVVGKTAIDDNAFRAAERIKATVCAKCRVKDRQPLPFGRSF